MIINFFLDNRIGGPHNYSNQLNKIFKKKFVNVTSGKSKFNSINITNLRQYSKYFFFFEIIVNFLEILFLFKKKKYQYFYVFSIFNFAPIISGFFLKKKIRWFIVEEPNLKTKTIFKLLNLIVNFDTIVISKFIAKKLAIKKYEILNPIINLNFWKNKKFNYTKSNILKITCVGNINKTKNYLILLEYLNDININFELNIVGEILNTQKKYFEKIKILQSIINKKKLKKVNILERQNSSKIKSLLNKTDLFILPSLSEGLSISLMEAMSMKCTCLISDNSNKSKIIKNNVNGFIFSLSKKSFEISIKKIISLDKKVKIRIQNSARKTIHNMNNNFSNIADK
ncbi:glycosyltransferase [Candidatus Pelagibacter sp.]|nr:glycosyltransferase [Candidatus Pelagibacter sp.]